MMKPATYVALASHPNIVGCKMYVWTERHQLDSLKAQDQYH